MSISRRRFLQWFGASQIAVWSGKTAAAATGRHFEGYPESNGVLFDNTLCIGCRNCEAACNQVNDLPEPEIPFDDRSVFDQIRRTENTAFTVVNRYTPHEDPDQSVYRKIQCNHCLEPACAAVCFVKAFKKTPSGAVVYDTSLCVGCRYCLMACPFEIPTYEYHEAISPRVRKCTLCHPRITEGLLPGCVEACPTGALIYGKRKDLIDIGRGRIDDQPDRYIHHLYGETEMGGTSWLYLSGTSYAELGQKEDLGVKPAIEFTAGSLSAVPMVIGLWPVFLVGAYAMTRRNEKRAQKEKQAAVEETLTAARAKAETELQSALERERKNKQKEIDKAVKKALTEADTQEGENTDSPS